MFITDKINFGTQRTYTDEGFLIVPARLARVGIQEYMAVEMGLTDRDPTDIIRVFRSEEEVFKEESLQSFANKPVTDSHPPELVTAANAQKYSKGHSGHEVVKDGIFSKTDLHIVVADTIAKVESGKVELSNGYTCDIEWNPGVSPEGIEFDCSQKNIKGNHIAIVEKGRAGSSCRLADNLPPPKEENLAMAKITIDGVDFEVTDQAMQAVNKLQTRLIDAEEKAQTEEEKKKAAEDEAEEMKKKSEKTTDALRAKLDDANSKIPSTETMDKMVSTRTALIDSVCKTIPGFKWQGKDSKTIMSEVVATKCPNVQVNSETEDYIKARFDSIIENAPTTNTLDEALKLQLTNDGDKDTRPVDVIARDKFNKDSRDAWKGGKK